MKTIVILLAVMAIPDFLALADEEPSNLYDPHAARPARPKAVEDLRVEATPAQPQPESADVVKADLLQKVIITADGDEIGVIRDVGYDGTGEPVAVVAIDAFVGVGEKRIAIPLSQLRLADGSSDLVMTVLGRDAIEAQEELDDADFTAAE